jgi:hypothetical protein
MFIEVEENVIFPVVKYMDIPHYAPPDIRAQN